MEENLACHDSQTVLSASFEEQGIYIYIYSPQRKEASGYSSPKFGSITLLLEKT
jgi:hypothetical protein